VAVSLLGDRFAHTHQANPDFVKVAEAMGVKGIRASKPEELSEKMAEMLAYDKGPILMEVIVDRKVPVLPMVPGGKGLHEFIAYDAAKEKIRRQKTKERSGR